MRAGGVAVTRMERFEWLAGTSAPKGCPMSLVSGEFHLADGNSLHISPESRLNSGWGAHLAVDVVGDELKPVPQELEVLFYSYLEDRFYHGAFPLPRDSITRLFREGYRSTRDPSGRTTYKFLVAGVAPGGAVAVWASGQGRQTEVLFGRASSSTWTGTWPWTCPPT